MRRKRLGQRTIQTRRLSGFPAAEALAEAALAAAPESNRQHVKTLVDSAQQGPYALYIHIIYTMADPCDEMNQYTQIFYERAR